MTGIPQQHGNPQYFFFICRVYEEDPEQCMQLCQALLDEPNVDTALRLGDVYGLMIEYYGQTSDYKQVCL